jgi:cytochrome c2
MIRPLLVVLAGTCCLLACSSPSSQQTNGVAAGSDSVAVKVPTATDSLSVELTRLRLPAAQPITVPDDPVYHARKRYEAVPLETVLRQIPGYANASPTQTQVVFECADGYKPSMPVAKVLSRKAYLAVRDAEATKGQTWQPLVKDGQPKEIAPFYVVYTDVPADDETFKWPYNLVKISLVPLDDELKALYPADDETLAKGYGLFKTNCLTCHALNRVGGQMGPELNVPKNVTEYWQPDHLKAFIQNPASYRAGVKMPRLAHLSEDDVQEIIRYLGYMAQHKKS